MPNPMMRDPFGSLQGFMGQFQGFMRNPMQYMVQRKLNLPNDWMQNPQGAIQQLMNEGKLSQQDYNQLQSYASRIQQMPQFQQFAQQMMGGQQRQN